MAAGPAILGAPRFFKRPHGAIAARLVLNQETAEQYRVRVPLLHSPDSSKGERPAHTRLTVEHYHVGRPFYCRSGGCAGCAPRIQKGASAPRIPPWQRSAMHRTRNADHAGAAPAGGSLSNGGRDVTASIRSCEDRRAGAAPVGLPTFKRAQGKGVEPSVCKTE